MDQVTDALSAAIASAVEALAADGAELPFYLATLAANGAYMVGAYREADDGGMSAEVMAGGEEPFSLPVNVMLSDTTGKAVRVRIAAESMTLESLH